MTRELDSVELGQRPRWHDEECHAVLRLAELRFACRLPVPAIGDKRREHSEHLFKSALNDDGRQLELRWRWRP